MLLKLGQISGLDTRTLADVLNVSFDQVETIAVSDTDAIEVGEKRGRNYRRCRTEEDKKKRPAETLLEGLHFDDRPAVRSELIAGRDGWADQPKNAEGTELSRVTITRGLPTALTSRGSQGAEPDAAAGRAPSKKSKKRCRRRDSVNPRHVPGAEPQAGPLPNRYKAFTNRFDGKRRNYSNQLERVWPCYIRMRTPYFGPVDGIWLRPGLQGTSKHLTMHHRFKLVPIGHKDGKRPSATCSCGTSTLAML